MNELDTTDRDVSRAVRSWLNEDQHEDATRVAGAVLDRLDTTPQRRATWWSAWRSPTMNKFVQIGLGAAAVVVVAIIGVQLFGAAPDIGTAPSASPSVAPSTGPSAAGWLPEGPFLVTADGSPVQVTVTIPGPGWVSNPQFELVSKGEDADPPEAAMLAWAFSAGTDFYVYGDPCHWESTTPDTPVTTVDEIAAGLAAQASREASEPVDVTVGGYTGKQITLHVPDDAPTRAEAFEDCDENEFASYGTSATTPERTHQGPGQVDELWILDVDGQIVILDAMTRPDTPAELADELRAVAESATFE